MGENGSISNIYINSPYNSVSKKTTTKYPIENEQKTGIQDIFFKEDKQMVKRHMKEC